MNYRLHYYEYAEYVKTQVAQKLRPRTKNEWHRWQKKGDTRYFEFHHILPRCMGGDESPENYIPLTSREHFLAHYLLTKVYSRGNAHHRVVYAFRCMGLFNVTLQRYINSRLYEALRLEFNEVMKNRYLSQETRQKISKTRQGKCFLTKEHKKATSERNLKRHLDYRNTLGKVYSLNPATLKITSYESIDAFTQQKLGKFDSSVYAKLRENKKYFELKSLAVQFKFTIPEQTEWAFYSKTATQKELSSFLSILTTQYQKKLQRQQKD